MMATCEKLDCSVGNLKHAHFLVVQYSALSAFAWHNDASDMRLCDNSITLIVPLNDYPSAIELWGSGRQAYQRLGRGVVVLAAARHCSVPVGPLTDTTELQLDVTCHMLMNCAPAKLALFFSK